MADHSGGLAAIHDEWSRHWGQGLAAFLAIATSFGAMIGVTSIFIIPLQEAFGWSRGEIALAQNAGLLAAATSPFLGRAVDRFGPRRLMLGGMVLSGIVYLGFAVMNGSLAQYYVLYALANIIGLTASGLTCSRVISENFVRSRGFSLAVARSGLSLTGAVLPPVMFAIISHYGWRAGYVTHALLIWVLALPCVYLWVRPRGEATRGATGAPAGETAMVPIREILGNWRVWMLCLGAALGYAPANAVMTQLAPLLVGKGIAPAAAAGLVGLAGVASLGGALLTGMLVDRLWAPAVAFVFACGSGLGTALLAFSSSVDGPLGTAAVLLIGLGLGAEIDVVAYMVARFFGVRSFSTIYGMTVLWIAGAGALGAAGLGLAYDHYGNYDAALMIIAASFFVSGLLYMTLGRYPRPEARAA